MTENTQNTPQASDVEQIKDDLANLYAHVGAALGKKTDEAKVKWNETQTALEAKKRTLENRAGELLRAGNAASADMKSGFGAAFAELKKAFSEAKAKFDSDK